MSRITQRKRAKTAGRSGNKRQNFTRKLLSWIDYDFQRIRYCRTHAIVDSSFGGSTFQLKFTHRGMLETAAPAGGATAAASEPRVVVKHFHKARQRGFIAKRWHDTNQLRQWRDSSALRSCFVSKDGNLMRLDAEGGEAASVKEAN